MEGVKKYAVAFAKMLGHDMVVGAAMTAAVVVMVWVAFSTFVEATKLSAFFVPPVHHEVVEEH